ncbi:MAG TPA: ADOP family duplicated permease [Thermoanaerobaculia bacterium]|nr:ADOP family duplicated permease [Thermoanaerobaculia bacterium]
MWTRLRHTFRALRRRPDWEDDLEQELRSHVELRAAELARAGLTAEQAQREARLELGRRETYKEQCRAAHGLRWPDELRQDLRFASRMLWHSPGFAAVAILSLAFGIGANTVVFSVLQALILKPLAVSAPERLVFLQVNGRPAQSFPNYRDLRDRNTTFAGLAAYRIDPLGLETADGARRVWGYLVTGNYFDLLGVRPARGRFFHQQDDRQPGASPYAVLSYTCWQNRFAADAQIVGKTIRINAFPYTVLGVAPRGFQGTELFYWPEIWVPMMMEPQIESRSWLDDRGTWNSWVIGRLRKNVTPQQATADLNAIASALAKEFPVWNEGLRLSVTRPGLVGDALRAPTREFTGGVMALAGLVLLAACANLASLLAARAADRDRELAIRLSIGAGRTRILRQLLVESLLLSLVGGAAGCGLAAVLLRLLSRWHAPLDFPVQFVVDPDATVFAFALAAALLTGLLFSIAPARQAWGANPNQALKGMPSTGAAGSRSGGWRRWRKLAPRDLLLALQVVLCCVLLTACFVALRGLASSLATPLGYDPRRVAVASFDLGLARFSMEDGRSFQRRALETVTRLPGASAAAFASSLPLSIDQSSTVVFAEDATDFRAAKARRAAYYDVSPGYFRATGTRLLAGREFSWQDGEKAPPVAVVNQIFARQVIGRQLGRGGGESIRPAAAVGRHFLTGKGRPPVEIVGVVEDGKYTSLIEAPAPALFRPAAQHYNGTTVVIVRSALPPSAVAGQIREAVAALEPRLALYGVGSLEQMLGFAFFPARAATVALGAFGVLAIMLALTGIYGLAAYAVARRVREIGIRVAVGARPGQVLRLVLGRIAALLAAGSAAGLLLGLAAARLLGSVVYQASPRDPLILPAVALTMAAIALAAAAAPARRALAVDPVAALRHE